MIFDVDNSFHPHVLNSNSSHSIFYFNLPNKFEYLFHDIYQYKYIEYIDTNKR